MAKLITLTNGRTITHEELVNALIKEEKQTPERAEKIPNIEKPYKITSVCKADLIQAFEDEGELTKGLRKIIMELTEAEMKWIASKMADAYVEYGGFWDNCRYYVNEVN